MAELSLLVKATVVLAVALAVSRAAQRAPAAVRALILASAFGVLLLIPIAAPFVEPRAVVIPVDPVAASFSSVEVVPAARRDASVARSDTPAEAGVPPFTMPSMAGVLRAVWIAGCVACCLPVASALWRLRRVRRRGRRWVEAEAMVASVARAARVERRVAVMLSGDIGAPMTWGLVRPVIALPLDTPAWSDTDLRHALVHEMEHVRRRDWVVHLLVRATCALYWFHPLVWAAWRQFRLECERACDDAVIRGADGTVYAEQLIALARRLTRGVPQPLLSMATESNLAARVNAVLDSGRARGHVGIARGATIVGAALAATLVLSPLQAAPRADAPASHQAFDATLTWRPTPEELGVLGEPVPNVPSTEFGASLFTALQEPFGLRRAAERGPVEFLVVEGAERPAPNGAADAPADQQQASAPAPSFEVTSVRRNTSDATGARQQFTDGRFTATNTTVPLLIRDAYRIQVFQIADGPEWLSSARFDIAATIPSNTSPEQRPLMLRALLAERFNLRTHMETRELPIFTLVLSREDGKPGPNLKASSQDCAAAATGGAMRAPVTATQPDGRPICGMTMGPAAMRGGGVAMPLLANALAQFARRPVVERTGLTGFFDFDLRYAAAGRGGTPPPATDERPSLFTAVQEQLGLRLDAATGPVEVLVIDRIDMPSEN